MRTEKEDGIDREERELRDREEQATTTSLCQSVPILALCVCVYVCIPVKYLGKTQVPRGNVLLQDDFCPQLRENMKCYQIIYCDSVISIQPDSCLEQKL